MALGDIDVEVRPRVTDEARAEFEAEVVRGLSAERKTLPCRFFYDARGSEL
ncbi:MAG: L-histidine N(alpha)-methyltransferase, partial [Proteobacteria bacterium]|nr:L-histidine N(alpha)-methyltransferase [Pseudomonadota bacterium]